MKNYLVKEECVMSDYDSPDIHLTPLFDISVFMGGGRCFLIRRVGI